MQILQNLSNDIQEIYHLLGIEAAREAIIFELTEVINDAGSYVNQRHISLLADIMTSRGNLMSTDRHGINRSDIGPLSKASFEETPDIIIKAALYGEIDKNGDQQILWQDNHHRLEQIVQMFFDENSYLQNLTNIEERETDITKTNWQI